MVLEMDEVRINNYYATQTISEFPDGEGGDSIPIKNKRTIRTPELIEKILKDPSLSKSDYQVDHLFPPNCRYYEKHNEGFFVVIEEPPAFRTITVDKDMSSEIAALKGAKHWEEYGYKNWEKENRSRPYQFTLALPYVVFFLTFTKNYDVLGGKVYFRTQEITGFSDILFKAPFLNISDSQTICFGDRIHKGPKRSIYTDVNYAISCYWSTIFNPDYIYNYHAYQQTPGVCDYFTWQYYSNIDPMFVYKADWLPDKGVTIGDEVERMKKWLFDREERASTKFGYNTLKTLFINSSEKGLIDVPGIKGAKEVLLFDVSNSMEMDENLMVDIGDSFKNNYDQLIHVDSFLGFRRMTNPMFISLQRHDGRLLKWKLTKKVIKYISKKVKEERHIAEVKLPSGDILKSGDIIRMKDGYGHDVYRKVYYIRLSVTGEVEARVGSEYYIIDRISKDAEVIDVSNPEYYEMILNRDDNYIVIRSTHHNSCPVVSIGISNFVDVITGRNGELVMRFDENRGRNKGYVYKIPMGQRDTIIRRVYPFSELQAMPDVFVLGRRLMWACDSSGSGRIMGKTYVLPEMGLSTEYSTSLRTADRRQYREKFIDGDKFKLETWNHIYDFEIGDKVVVANWDNPVDMLTVKQIQGFVENKDSGDIGFTLLDKNNQVSMFKYIDGERKCAKIGSVRKITNVFGDLSAGMKIIANQAGVSMFPKKDTNIIIGFLYDTGGPEPLVLCSNACTLWYSDVVEKFDIIKMDDPAWKTKQHAPITPSKMRYQAGDILQGKRHFKNDFGFLVYRPRDQRTVRASHMGYYHSYDESFVFDRSFTEDVMFDTFPNPRLSVSQENKLGFVNAFPNFHGMYTVVDKSHSPYSIANDTRSILNVSSDNQ